MRILPLPQISQIADWRGSCAVVMMVVVPIMMVMMCMAVGWVVLESAWCLRCGLPFTLQPRESMKTLHQPASEMHPSFPHDVGYLA